MVVKNGGAHEYANWIVDLYNSLSGIFQIKDNPADADIIIKGMPFSYGSAMKEKERNMEKKTKKRMSNKAFLQESGELFLQSFW